VRGASTAASKARRASLRTLLAACTVSMAAAALLTSWAMTAAPRRGGEAPAALARVAAPTSTPTADAAPAAAADERVARVEGHASRLPPAAAPARSGRREATRPVLSAPRAREPEEAAAPVRAETADAPQGGAEAAPSVMEPSDPAPDPRPGPAPDAAPPDLRAGPSGRAEPAGVAGTPFASDRGLASDPDAR
jgi:hypothetical protein